MLGFVTGFHTAYGRTSFPGEGIGKRPGTIAEIKLVGSTLVIGETHLNLRGLTLTWTIGIPTIGRGPQYEGKEASSAYRSRSIQQKP